jgi:cytochrome c-type biogenesis protein CcmH/NrfG
VIIFISTACRISPQQKEAKYLQRGQIQLAKKDFVRAMLEFKNAAEAMPRDAEPHYQAGLAYLAMGNGKSAVAAFLRAATLNPKHAGAQLKIAELMTASGKKDLLEDAARRLQDLLVATPDNVAAIDTLALAEFELGKSEDAGQTSPGNPEQVSVAPAVLGCPGTVEIGRA